MPSETAFEPAGAGSPRPVVVVPCYNEAGRIDGAEMCRLAATVDVWLVDDGSKDATFDVLGSIAAQSGGTVSARRNDGNRGKGETCRLHMLAACEAGAPVVGFLDADLATPVDEMLRLLATLAESDAEAVTAARVALSGRDIRRSGARHYAGRVFSTIASLAIGATYYDTQCGAKLFRRTPALGAALSDPFVSRWAFDVELLGRLLAGAPGVEPVPAQRLVEVPIATWHDVAGSKLTPGDAWTSFVQLFIIWRDLARRRAR
jgi:dolichyl-phosphate beta-glucosyltransferase